MKSTVHPPFAQIGGVHTKVVRLSYYLLCISSVQQCMEFSTVDSSGVHNYYWKRNYLRLEKGMQKFAEGECKICR